MVFKMANREVWHQSHSCSTPPPSLVSSYQPTIPPQRDSTPKAKPNPNLPRNRHPKFTSRNIQRLIVISEDQRITETSEKPIKRKMKWCSMENIDKNRKERMQAIRWVTKIKNFGIIRHFRSKIGIVKGSSSGQKSILHLHEILLSWEISFF